MKLSSISAAAAGAAAFVIVSVAGGVAGAAQTSQVSGAELYSDHCAVCHGEDGKGNGPLASALTRSPTDLTDISRRNNGTFPSDLMYRTIDGANRPPGHGGGEMPLWGECLRRPLESTKAKIDALVRYLEQLQPRN